MDKPSENIKRRPYHKHHRPWWQDTRILVPLLGIIPPLVVAFLNPDLVKVILDYFKPVAPPIVMMTETATPLAVASLTAVPPTDIAPATVEIDTPVPTNTPALIATDTPVIGTCPWLPFSTLDPSVTIGANCLNDLLLLGISGGDQMLFYRRTGMGVGVFGISRKLETGSEVSVRLKLRELYFVRFFVLVGENATGYKSSLGFRIVPEGNERYIQLLKFDKNGFDDVESDITELPLWGGKLILTLKFQGSQVKAYVNDTYFGETQITFSDRYLFLGYQSLQNANSHPYIDVTASIP